MISMPFKGSSRCHMIILKSHWASFCFRDILFLRQITLFDKVVDELIGQTLHLWRIFANENRFHAELIKAHKVSTASLLLLSANAACSLNTALCCSNVVVNATASSHKSIVAQAWLHCGKRWCPVWMDEIATLAAFIRAGLIILGVWFQLFRELFSIYFTLCIFLVFLREHMATAGFFYLQRPFAKCTSRRGPCPDFQIRAPRRGETRDFRYPCSFC